MTIIRSLLPFILAALSGSSASASESTNKNLRGLRAGGSYEVWGSDQSNSVHDATGPGVKGSYLWIWDSNGIKDQLDGEGDAVPLSCTPDKPTGPCDLLDVFPQDLHDNEGNELGDLFGFGRLHGMITDPSNRYVTANIFTPKGGFVGVIDTSTKEAIALFRVGATSGTGNQRSVHMSIWSEDGAAILVDNLHGKMIERIDVTRDADGVITKLKYNQSASVYLGKNFELVSRASAFSGTNALGNQIIGQVVGSYQQADTSDLTPAGVCKEEDCDAGVEPDGGSRVNNVPICPITSSNGNAYVTLGGGGLFVLKTDKTPMQIVGEYGSKVVNGAGCGGVESKGSMFLNAGVSASGAGAKQSTFSVYAFTDSAFDANADPQQNFPEPTEVFKDRENTNTIGNTDGLGGQENNSGQKPSTSTRRDSHGAAVTLGPYLDKYLHVADRIQNVIEVFDTEFPYEHVSTYSLTTKNGNLNGKKGPCAAASVTDDSTMELNDPAPDLADMTPDGKYLMIAFRGPKPVSVGHAAQGSCPGVGIVEITKDGKAGKLVGVLRSTNTVDNVPVGSITGGYNYTGTERSDIHGAIVVRKDKK